MGFSAKGVGEASGESAGVSAAGDGEGAAEGTGVGVETGEGVAPSFAPQPKKSMTERHAGKIRNEFKRFFFRIVFKRAPR